MFALGIALFGCAAWTYLLFFRGGFWRGRERDDAPGSGRPAAGEPELVAVIPARNEAEVIDQAVTSLLRQRYEGNFSIIVVDDGSSDGTAEIAVAAAAAQGAQGRLTVVKAPALAAGWTGKLWAQEQGLAHLRARPQPPRYVLLSDADIVYAPEVVAELIGRAERDQLVLVSRMARLHCVSLAERIFIPAFIFFFQMVYPFAWVNDPRRRTAAAAGGCMLVRWTALEGAGGVAAIRGAIIDDCALAKRLKPSGPIELVLSEKVVSLRQYLSSRGIRDMIVRSAYAQLRFSPWRLAGTLIAMAATYLAPPVLAVAGSGAAALLAVGAWVLMALSFRPTLRMYGLTSVWGVLLPVIALFYVVLTVQSAVLQAQGRGGRWKGRTYNRSSPS
jgi:hopene-associated glycosyltransferase HpnB